MKTALAAASVFACLVIGCSAGDQTSATSPDQSTPDAAREGTSDAGSGPDAPTGGDAGPKSCFEQAQYRATDKLDAGVSAEEVQQQFGFEIQQCITPGWSDNANHFAADINEDRRQSAQDFLGKIMAPPVYAALARDRDAKVELSHTDPTWIEQYAQGDEDHDFVPDARDQCPQTARRTPTDKDGCPTQIAPGLSPDQCQPLMAAWKASPSTATPPPQECMVYQIIDQGVVPYQAACDGAPVPSVPIPLLVYPERTGYVRMEQVRNQPQGCTVFYEVEIAINFPHRASHRLSTFRTAYASAKDTDPDPSAAQFTLPPGMPVYAAEVEFDRIHRWRARAINGNGQKSLWSSWFELSCSNHHTCPE